MAAAVLLLALCVLPAAALPGEGGVQGHVVDKSLLTGIPGVRVSCDSLHLWTFTGQDGLFHLEGISPGRYRLRASAPGYAAAERAVTVGPGGVAAVTFALVQVSYEVEPVVVTATRSAARLMDVPSAVAVAPAEVLARSADLEEAINLLPGVLTRSYGPLGDVRTVSIRGSTAGQVLVLVDGRRENGVQSGEVDLSTIPLEGVERVEVIRGGASALYGADAVGGVLNIITRSRTGQEGLRGAGEILRGSFGTSGGRLTGSYTTGSLFSTATFRYLSSRGDYPYQASDGAELLRANAALVSRSLFGKAVWSPGGPDGAQDMTLSWQLLSSNAGSPGAMDQLTPRAHKTTRNGTVELAYGHRFAEGDRSLRARVSYQNSLFTYEDPDSYVPVDSRAHAVAMSGELQGQAVMGAGNMMTAGVALRDDRLAGTSLDARHTRGTASIFVQDEIRLPLAPLAPAAHLLVLPAVRWDRFSDFGAELSPRLGVVLAAGDRWQVALKGNVGRSFRAPTFNDLYWPRDNFATGNPHLAPEHGTEIDGGCMLQAPHLLGMAAEAIWYHNRLRDMILWQPGRGGLWMPDNVGRADLSGVETQVSLRPLDGHLMLLWNYTLLDARDRTRGDDAVLPYRARHVHHLVAQLQVAGVRLSASLAYTGRRFTTASNTISLPASRVVDLLAGYAVPLGGLLLDLSTQVLNAGDLRYQATEGYPMPGREVRLRLEVRSPAYPEHSPRITERTETP